MTKILNYIKTVIIIAVIGYIACSYTYLRSLRSDNARLSGNQEHLLTELAQTVESNRAYRIADSLNGIWTDELLLTLSEYERYRSEDAALIARLTSSNDNLERVVSAQSRTISELRIQLTDSVVVDPDTNTADTLKCFSHSTEWVDVEGCMSLRTGSMDLQIENRESIRVIETVRYRRFWGFLWKTGKVESRKVDVVSDNPNTVVVESEFISIIQ